MARLYERLQSGRESISMLPFSNTFDEAVKNSPVLQDFYDNFYNNLTEFFVSQVGDATKVTIDSVTDFLYGEEGGRLFGFANASLLFAIIQVVFSLLLRIFK